MVNPEESATKQMNIWKRINCELVTKMPQLNNDK